jgi:parallel beta-helix repeat protein
MKRATYIATAVAIAASAVVLVQAATASPVTIRCVNSGDPSCGPSYATISLAVAASDPRDIVLVGKGTYMETVTVDKTLRLLGAQHGMDARTRSTTKESIVDGTGTGTSTIIITGQNVVVDGFTVQGGIAGNATGIDVKGGASPGHGARILNNIVQNNSTGVSLNSEGFAAVMRVVIEHNLIKRNNDGDPSVAGDGIFTSATSDVVIDENKFQRNSRLGIGINNSSDVSITNNTSTQDGRFVVFTGTTDSLVSRNKISNLLDTTLVNDARAAGISVGFDNSYLTITNNTIKAATGGVHRGIQFGGYGPNPANTDLTVKYNRISGMPVHGIVAEDSLLTDSILIGNRTTGNVQDGIRVEAGNSDNYLSHNFSKSNGGKDCRDNSVGTETLGTDNVWFKNVGNSATPAGLCKP